MNITAKSRYALKVMMDLAVMHDVGQQTRLSISQRHGIPIDFMDQILARLKSAKLIQTTRGRSGGISLSLVPADISLWQIFRAVEDNLYPVQCLEVEGCAFDHECISKDIWTKIFSGIQAHLEGLSLQQAVAGQDLVILQKNGLNQAGLNQADLIQQGVMQEGMIQQGMIQQGMIHECKAPKRTSLDQADH